MPHNTQDAELRSMLSNELERLRDLEERLQRQRQSVLDEIETTRRRRELTQALLANMGIDGDTSAENAADPGRHRASTPVAGANNVNDIAHEILLARGQNPMHYEDLLQEVISAGGSVGGANPAQTLVSRLARDPRFVRPTKRGWYAAASLYPETQSVGKRRGKPSGAKRPIER